MNADERGPDLRGVTRHLIALAVGLSTLQAGARDDAGARVRGLAAEFAGELGVYAKHLGTGDVIALNADTRFPTASVIKVAIMVAAGRRAAISAGPRDFPEHALALKHSSTRLASARRGTPTGHA